MPSILLVDDETSIQHAFRKVFRDGDDVRTLHVAGTAAEAVQRFTEDKPDVVVLDVHLPDATGLETFHRLQKLDARVPIVLITGHGTTDLAIEAMKAGAFDILLKPLELGELRDLVGRAIRSSRLMMVPAEMAGVESNRNDGDLLIGRCPAMQDVFKSIGRVADQDVTVLILGDSGTGKELVARAIYQHSRRAAKPFLAINCAAIPETLLESELFGHERGAFTGADRKRIGKFEQSNGGTIFLDEVGEMSPLTQAKILRLIQEQRFERVGGDETISTDVRIIAATNADLEATVNDGRFRKDLYFRLNVFSIQLPPLRDRGDDLDRLIEHFLGRYSKELNKAATKAAPEALEILRAYSWPGNVRELQSALKQALLHSRGTMVLADDLPQYLTLTTAVPTPSSAPFDWDTFVATRLSEGSETLYADAIERLEREVIVRVLQHTAGNQVQAARILGITRGSLRTKIRSLGIAIGRTVWSDDDHGDA